MATLDAMPTPNQIRARGTKATDGTALMATATGISTAPTGGATVNRRASRTPAAAPVAKPSSVSLSVVTRPPPSRAAPSIVPPRIADGGGSM